MTVKELIAQLQQIEDKDMKVDYVVRTRFGDIEETKQIANVSIWNSPNTKVANRVMLNNS